MVIYSWYKAFWILLVLVTLQACQHPYRNYQQQQGYEAREVQGAQFRHRVIARPAPGRFLHVYLEGDGRPWRSRYQVALDPTPPQLLMLELMAQDPAPALYLGRPCYLSIEDKACHFLWWTHQRYAEAIVESLDAVLDQYASEYEGLYLFGHSGGGSLAMLLAARRSDVEAVVTLAGNLDIEGWTALHAYSPLDGSLNPRDYPLPESVAQWHFVGSEDEVIPPALLQRSAKTWPQAQVKVINGIDHSCCWAEQWSRILVQVQ